MKEISDIIAAYDIAVSGGKRCALATVVHVEGSSYRRPGARMLVTEDGLLTGAISGGCLEGDALKKALLAIHQNQNKLVTYDTTDEDATLGVQLGCNGIVHILFEPLDPEITNAITLLRHVNRSRHPAMVVTAFSLTVNQPQYGTVLASSNSGEIQVDKASPELFDVIHREMTSSHREENSSRFIEFSDEGKKAQLFLQILQPSVSLMLVGAGNDAIPLSEISKILGWEVMVIDGRKTHATQKRFPGADKVVVSKAESILDHVKPDHLTAAVLMTHNYNYDIEALEQLLQTTIRYIGILGPRKKLLKMYDDLAMKRRFLNEEDKERIYSPVGLDLGSETAEEIALSIIAEIKGVLSGTSLQQLRLKTEPIHGRSPQTA